MTTLFLFRYESTSSEESSGEEKPKAEVEEENSSEPEEETEKKTDSQLAEKPVEEAEAQQKDVDVPAAEGGASGTEQQSERGLMDPEVSSELLEDQAEGWGRRWTIVSRLNYFSMTEEVLEYEHVINAWGELLSISSSWKVIITSLGLKGIS